MLAARGVFLAARRNRKPTAKSYVQDGLIAMWDGIENAGWGTHDANATTWKDLSGNGYDLTPHGNVSWQSNSARFDGASYFRRAAISGVAVAECVFARRVPTGFFVVFQNNFSCLIGLNNNFICLAPTNGSNMTYYRNTYQPILDTMTHQLSCNYLSWTMSKDGVEQTPVGTNANGAVGNYLQLGARVFNNAVGGYFDGDLYTVRLYSRAPTAAEIAANYAVDKARFNLP